LINLFYIWGVKIAKIDLKKEYKELYSPKKDKISFIEVPKFKYLSIEGKGNPNTSIDYQNSINALMPVSFKTKFLMKKEYSSDYVVMPLEGLWWADNIEDFRSNNKDVWKWKSMIMQPDFVEKEHINQAIDEVLSKKDISPDIISSIEKIKFEDFKEGLSAQILHVGSYSDEKSTINKLHENILDNGYEFNGLHHEIYLSDVRRTKPEKLRTIIRQPIIKN
jgi:hypothetical protein